MAETMQAFELRKFAFDGLMPAERPMPEPGPHEALVKIRATALNFRDVSLVLGYYNPRQKLPLIPLSDAVGEVVALGPGVTRVKVGDRVCPTFFPNWLSGDPHPQIAHSTWGSPQDGMLCEYRAIPAEALVRPPAHLSDAEAATLGCAGVTAWRAMFDLARMTPGQTLLVEGTGGVATFGIVFAKLAGLRAIVISSSDEKLARARTLGAHETINYRTNPDWEHEVLRLTQGVGVHCTLEIGGAGTLPKALIASAFGGTIVCIGFLGGLLPELSVALLLTKNIRIEGVTVGSRAEFEAMNHALELAHARPPIDREFAFADSPQALPAMKDAQHFGKLVIRVG